MRSPQPDVYKRQGMTLCRKVIFGMALIVLGVDIGRQNAGKAILPAAAAGKLAGFGKVRNQVDGKARSLQVNAIRGAGAGNVLGDFQIALCHLVCTCLLYTSRCV